MTKNIGHHYITESYQRNFADSEGHIWVIDSELKIYPTNPENTFKEAHFNTVKLAGGGGSLVVEKALADIEGPFASAVQKLESGELLTLDDRAFIAMFVAAMFTRTKRQRDHMRSQMENVIRKGEMMKAAVDASPDKSRFKHLSGGSAQSISLTDLKEGMKDYDHEHAAMIPQTIVDISPVLEQMKWSILEAPEGKVFISSDAPLCMCSPSREKEYGRRSLAAAAGLLDPDVEITFPLSSRFALVMGWQMKENTKMVATEGQVDQINYRTMRTAGSVIANNKQFLEDHAKKVKEARGEADSVS